jgi:hypothetical protein
MAAAAMSSSGLGSVFTAVGLAEIAVHEKRQLRRFAVQRALARGGGSTEPESCRAAFDFAEEFKVIAEGINGKSFASAGLAFVGVRRLLPRQLATSVKGVLRCRNAAAHPPKGLQVLLTGVEDALRTARWAAAAAAAPASWRWTSRCWTS